ncbi:Tubulin alpha-1C chain [Oopsacas minuta]|uniref:Tubulin alpha-1C chain n=1 Tax=Oopsacas minuta TaxID=111878 RepID=A0AAV7JZ94_9METZ|nr:Tubulin alpha-1C chain [Oopsacas minuta]
MRQGRGKLLLTITLVCLILTTTLLIYNKYNSNPKSLNLILQKNFHFIWISPTLDKTTIPSIETDLMNNIKSCRILHPNWKFIIWTDDTVRLEFPELSKFLIKVKTPAAMSDILRIYILVRYGGVYLDMDVTCIQNIESLLQFQYCTAFVGNEESMVDNGVVIHITNALVASTANHRILTKAAEEIINTALDDVSPDIKTGRVFLANIINKYNTTDDDCIYVYRKKVFYPCAFIEREHCSTMYQDSKHDPEVYTFHWWKRQAGCNIGNTLWELYCMENGLGRDGNLVDANSDHFYHDTTFFTQNSKKHYTPRSIFVDFDSVNIDAIKTCYPKLYNPDSLISKQNGLNTFATGYHTEGKLILESVMEEIRRICEVTDRSKIFWIFHSLSGGTGSGLGSLILDEINCEYKGIKFQVATLPDTDKLSSLECYNSTLSFSSCIELADMSLFFSNRKIAQILQQDYHTVPLTNTNRHICIALSSLTSSCRQSFGKDISDQIDIKVYPRMHYPLISYYPTSKIHQIYKESPTVKDLTIRCFDSRNVVLEADPSFGLYINVNLFYRGDVQPRHVIESFVHLGDNVELLYWTPAGLKISYSDHSRFISPERDLLRVNRSVCMVSQNTIFKEYLKGLSDKFSATFRKKEFLDLYIKNGVEELEFQNSKENIDSLIQEYEELI